MNIFIYQPSSCSLGIKEEKIIIVNPNLFIVANTFWTVLIFVNKKTYSFLPICVSLPISEGLRRLREGKGEGEDGGGGGGGGQTRHQAPLNSTEGPPGHQCPPCHGVTPLSTLLSVGSVVKLSQNGLSGWFLIVLCGFAPRRRLT